MKKSAFVGDKTGMKRAADFKNYNIALFSISRGNPLACFRLTGSISRQRDAVLTVGPVNQARTVKSVRGRGFSVFIFSAVLSHSGPKDLRPHTIVVANRRVAVAVRAEHGAAAKEQRKGREA